MHFFLFCFPKTLCANIMCLLIHRPPLHMGPPLTRSVTRPQRAIGDFPIRNGLQRSSTRNEAETKGDRAEREERTKEGGIHHVESSIHSAHPIILSPCSPAEVCRACCCQSAAVLNRALKSKTNKESNGSKKGGEINKAATNLTLTKARDQVSQQQKKGSNLIDHINTTPPASPSLV